MNPPMKGREFRLAENLKKAFGTKRLTISTAAKRIGMNKSTLHGYYNGVLPRNLQKIRDLADLLEMPFSELLFGKDEDESPSTNENFEGRYDVVIRRLNKNHIDRKR